MPNLKHQWEKLLGRFALVRSVTWVFVSTFLLANSSESIQGLDVLKIFGAVYQFYALFCIYAYVQLMEGLKYVRIWLSY